jgi:hypothetical protein
MIGTKYGHSFNGIHLKRNNYFLNPIRSINRGRLNNLLHETHYRGGHLNQEHIFK